MGMRDREMRGEKAFSWQFLYDKKLRAAKILILQLLELQARLG